MMLLYAQLAVSMHRRLSACSQMQAVKRTQSTFHKVIAKHCNARTMSLAMQHCRIAYGSQNADAIAKHESPHIIDTGQCFQLQAVVVLCKTYDMHQDNNSSEGRLCGC
jgi:hypothetical protein